MPKKPLQIRIAIPEPLQPYLERYRKDYLHANDAQAAKEILRQFLMNHYPKGLPPK